MKAKDNAQNGAKKGDKTSREKLITAIVALLVIVGGGTYSRLPISTGKPFKIAVGNAVLDPRTSHGHDFFDNGFEVKELMKRIVCCFSQYFSEGFSAIIYVLGQALEK